jgi:hypothetical protein
MDFLKNKDTVKVSVMINKDFQTAIQKLLGSKIKYSEST